MQPNQRWASKLFLTVRESQILTFLGSFLNRKSANLLGVQIRKSQVCSLLLLIRKLKICNFEEILHYPSPNFPKSRLLFFLFSLCTNLK
jgi:hypothetical protein